MSKTAATATAVAALICCCVLSGCIPYAFHNSTKDATNDPDWWGEQLRPNTVLRLKQDALLSGEGVNLGARLPTDAPHISKRVTVEEYKANRSNYSNASISLLSEGTRFRCVKLERFFNMEFSAYRLYAVIIDGEFSGKLVSIPVTGDPSKRGTLRLNASFLEKVD